jgi:hypothetical protein
MRTIFLAVTLLSAVGLAQPAGRPGARYMRLFDPKTVITVDGKVTEVRHVEHEMMGMHAVEATVKTADATYAVHLGPAWFIDNQELTLAAGDEITLTGSKISLRGEPTIIAAELQRGDDTLKLREKDGTPVWVAWRRRGAPGT